VSFDISALTIPEVFSIAIQLEEMGSDFYRAAARNGPSKRVKDMLNLLADQEGEHKMVFEDMATDLGIHLFLDDDSKAISPQNMQALVDAGIFPRPEEREAAIASLHSPAQALRFAIQAEKGSITFYEAVAAAREYAHIHQACESIVIQERRHLQILKAEMEALKVHSVR
jgi:rubrerythrin